jgi:hypothetical protein
MRYLASIGLLALCASASQGQQSAGGTSLRIAWESDPPAHGLQAVCGRVFNDGPVDARRVRVRVEGLNESGEVTSRRDGDVLGQVSSRGIGRFCLTMAAGAASYRVTIISTQWAAAPESP